MLPSNTHKYPSHNQQWFSSVGPACWLKWATCPAITAGESTIAPCPIKAMNCTAGCCSIAIGCRAVCKTSKPGTSRKIITTSRLRTLSSREYLKNNAIANKNEKKNHVVALGRLNSRKIDNGAGMGSRLHSIRQCGHAAVLGER